MGIDIREGQQMECITCALCIDACDDVMDKIGKPRGLIDYLALSDEPRERAGEAPRPVWQHVFRLRTILYTILWASMGLALVYALFIRTDIELTVSPVRNPTYVVQSDGSVRNIYDVRLRNKSGVARPFHLNLTSEDVLRIELEGASDRLVVDVAANSTHMQRVYVTARPGDPAATRKQTDLRIWVEDLESGARAGRATTFHGRDQ
jgi:polyferredoxin